MKLRRILRLGIRHFGPLCRALGAVLAFRIALVFFKYRQIAGKIHVQHARAGQSSEKPIVTAWAGKQAARVVPFASCLTQALALQYLLAANAHSSVVRVGVRTDEKNTVHAHSWVLLDDVVILGGSSEKIKEYTVLTDLSPAFDG